MNTALHAASLCAALGLGLAIGEYRATPLDPRQESAPQAGAPEASAEDAMMAAWLRAGTPGEHHRHLDALVGTWDAEVSLWMDPTQPPDVSEGTMTNRWILDGHYLEHDFEGTAMGLPFSGKGILAYDNAAQTYRGIWIDSMSTHLLESAGSVSEDGQRWTMVTTSTDPLTGEPVRGKEETVIEGPDRHVLTSWMEAGDDWVKSMQIVYTRAE